MDKKKFNAVMQTTLKLMSLKEDNQQYILGYIDGAFELKQLKEVKEKNT
ncbi:hypothetical protein [uncultured Clostridium sp.]|nr:hypothetical protein [uncultured Clostridium sp.]